MADIGDISGLLKEGSGSGLVDLDWLDVDEEDYRKLDTLPKQNLDCAPDLAAIWQHEDQASTKFVPNTGGPKTMGDLSDAHGQLRSKPEDLVVRTARTLLMQTSNGHKIREAMTSRFDSHAISQAKTALSGVFAERGLLGGFYIQAADFPGCHKGSTSDAEFVRRYASDAKFVVAKDECSSCVHKHEAAGKSHCGVFHKEIVVQTPYTPELAEEIERRELAKGKRIEASTMADPRTRIRAAILANIDAAGPEFSGHVQPAPKPFVGDTNQVLIAASNLTKKRDEKVRQKLAEDKARPVINLIRRELLKGRSEKEVLHAIRLSFDKRELAATREFWEPMFRQAGLFGTVYTTQDAFDDCREGADFLARHASKARAVVAGQKCDSCIFNKSGRCLMYGRKLVESASELFDDAMVRAVIDEHRMAGKIPFDSEKRQWGATPVESLKAVYRAASSVVPPPSGVRAVVERGYHGVSVRTGTSDLVKRDIVRVASQYMNEGLYGEDLLTLLKSRFDVRDLVAAKGELKIALAEQGLQGIKYIDPTAYDDYGNGCREASRRHRTRAAVKYLKLGDKCGSCVHHTRPGFCSVIDKELVIEPPYIDKKAEQQAILESGRSTEVSYESLMNNGLTMMQEFDLQRRAAEVTVDPLQSLDVEIELGSQSHKL